jgi:hypothetical protein
MSNATLIKSVGGEQITYEDLQMYYELNEQVKDLTKTMDKYKEKIKNAMVTNDLDTLTAGEYVATITNRTTKKVDDDMLSQVLVANGLNDATEVKVLPVKEKVLMAIKEGRFQQAQYDLCTSQSISQVIQVKRKALSK